MASKNTQHKMSAAWREQNEPTEAERALLVHQVSIPCGTQGAWTLDKFTLDRRRNNSASSAERKVIDQAIGLVDRSIPAGTYSRIWKREPSGRAVTVMTDTPAEIREHLPIIDKAHGRCLVNGLGLGMVAAALLAKESVDCVVVIEQSPDVIALVAPTLFERFGRKRLQVLNADALTCELWMGSFELDWRTVPMEHPEWDFVWHDIWDDISDENIAEMEKLRERFATTARWQECWAEGACWRMRFGIEGVRELMATSSATASVAERVALLSNYVNEKLQERTLRLEKNRGAL